MEKQKIAYMTATRKIELGEGPVTPMRDDSVKVKIETVGICGSDVYFYESGHCGPDPLPLPIVLGHECADTVVETGKNVGHIKPGDRVCLEPGVPCGRCEFCMTGRYNLCPQVEFMAAPPNYLGCLKEYVVHPAHMAFKLPPALDTVDGALIEPLAVGMHAACQGGAAYGKSAVILGAGCIGLMTLMACRAMGMREITVVDLFEKRLEKARELGASHTVNAAEEGAVQTCLGLYPGGADIVFETAGSIPTTQQTGALVKAGGVITLVGNTHGQVPYDFFEIMNKEVTVRCVFRYRSIYPLAIDAVERGLIQPKKLVTHTFDFADTDRAFQSSIKEKKEIIKAVIRLGSSPANA